MASRRSYSSGWLVLAMAAVLASAINGQFWQNTVSQLTGDRPLSSFYQSGMSSNLLLREKECESNDRTVGACISNTQCRLRKGKNVGSCPGLFKICCQETRTCNEDVKRNNTYFVQPPVQSAQGMQCPLRVHKLPGVCQLRLDFAQFSLRGPDPLTTRCDRDRFIVSGHDFNSIVPPICGENRGQHMYVDVASVKGPIQLLMTTSEKESEVTMNRQWSVRITQIPCTSLMKAPQGCLQYFTGPIGQNIRSFNYGNTRPDEDSYPGGLDYTVCIRKELGLCSGTFESVGKFGLNAADTEPIQTGPNCDNDYLLIGETRYCGGTGLPNARQGAGTPDETPKTRGTGPLLFDVVSGTNARTPPDTTRAGFNLRYKQESCRVK